MIASGQTLTRIHSIAQLYQTGYRSNIIDYTIKKLVYMEQTRLETEVSNLSTRLLDFEDQYHLPSDEFYRRFQAGEMGDEADMFEWSAFYQMRLSTQKQLDTLRSDLSQ